MALLFATSLELDAGTSNWYYYGGDPSGTRYSPHAQINTSNVSQLELAWTYHTGEIERRGEQLDANSTHQNTPVMVGDSLMVCTPFNRLIALDPATGRERWVFDPEVDLGHPLPQYNCRGVAGWTASRGGEEDRCKQRVFMGTNDSRLIAVDAKTGNRCHEFGQNGEVAVRQHKALQFAGERKIASAPVVVNDVVVVGSYIMDNVRTDAPAGTVFAFDAYSGKEVWRFDPIPRTPENPAYASWHDDSALNAGAANVWSSMVADPPNDLIFLPVGSAAPDFWGGARPGNNLYSSSLVALHGKSGEVAWHFQLVHHDIWDYDAASPPMLIDIDRGGETIPAVVQNTKQGLSFVFNRLTGEPVFGVEERPVPQHALPGEWLSPTQPFPLAPPPLTPTQVTPDDAWGFTFFDRWLCRRKIAGLRSEGIFTPPSTEGTIQVPGSAGGMNWGGPAYDPQRQLMIVNTNTVVQVITMIPLTDETSHNAPVLHAKSDVSAPEGAPYGVHREWLLSPLGAPCTAPPWGELLAVDMNTGSVVWRVALGSIEKMLPLRFEWNLGTPNMGGPIVTAGGLVFIGAAMDGYLRAFDIESGNELWKEELPGGTQTTPMTYLHNGNQYVVMVSGRHGWFQTPSSDAVVAYRLFSR
ncbi:pyrroloquinoline quinone-dependent dehydrogenase [Seongchinamella unica]|uniref:Pyrroloquinoline quinone-dependent dehydrogenase n=1 Tax=Seongchinamella unica TaxID=2547392 RepID=A0A4R5LR58_9GAMM|nr:pyrroloquinoline quinone-dependent dehydrogenase [Seongchinamella unica]TDG13322.1 pyrroloquinoline quinone-dependent dehydrogenase [Seongchinamella unica]